MCGDALAATSNDAVKPPIAPEANRYDRDGVGRDLGDERSRPPVPRS